MIAHLNTIYVRSQSDLWLSRLISSIVANNHKIKCDNDVTKLIENAVNRHCGTLERELFSNASLYEINALMLNNMTIIDVNGSLSSDQYLNLFGTPSLVLLENSPYEWPVYKMMIDVYKQDRQYGNLFKMLKKAVSPTSETLKSLHAGGNGLFVEMIQLKESESDYDGITKYKIFAVTDSDRIGENCPYDGTQKKNYKFLSKKEGDVDRKFIDTLNQPHYHWHMWRKRAIENYFPPEKYEMENLDAQLYKSILPPDRFFLKVEDHVKGYHKEDLSRIARHMGRNDYESISDSIYIEGNEISEIRLFLLKMIRVI